MRLVIVYSVPGYLSILYQLLSERTAEQSISHDEMPSFDEHKMFVQSMPYRYWYFIEVDNLYVGAIYLTRAEEVGLFIFKEHQGIGYGGEALAMFRKKHPGDLLANVAPDNELAHKFWTQQGGEVVQVTYKL